MYVNDDTYRMNEMRKGWEGRGERNERGLGREGRRGRKREIDDWKRIRLLMSLEYK